MNIQHDVISNVLEEDFISTYKPAIVGSMEIGYFKVTSIESDYPEIKVLAKKLLNNDNLSIDETNIIKNSSITSITLTKEGFVKNDIGYKDIYLCKIVSKEELAPLSVALFDMNSFNPFSYSRRIDLPY